MNRRKKSVARKSKIIYEAAKSEVGERQIVIARKSAKQQNDEDKAQSGILCPNRGRAGRKGDGRKEEPQREPTCLWLACRESRHANSMEVARLLNTRGECGGGNIADVVGRSSCWWGPLRR